MPVAGQSVGRIFVPDTYQKLLSLRHTCRPSGAWENWFTDVLYTYRPSGAF